MVGDIVHNLRTSLDNLVYALAVKESGEHAADCSTTLQFPIADYPNGWWNPAENRRERSRIEPLSDEARTAIEAMRPCNRADKSAPHYLSVLKKLSNTDKHERIAVTIMYTSDVAIRVTGDGVPAGMTMSDFRSPIDGETTIGLWQFVPPGSTAPVLWEPPNMQLHCDLSVDVLFGAGTPAPGQPARNILTYTLQRIRDDNFPALDAILDA